MFDIEKSKIIETLMSTSRNLDKDENGKSVEERKYWGWYGLFYMSLHLVLISCLIYVPALAFKHSQNNHISMWSNALWDTSLEHNK